jgi:uncharacterized protein involved in propanediol utilization
MRMMKSMAKRLHFSGVDGSIGTGHSPAHHGELLQGAFEMSDGVHRGLVTLPCALFWTHATATLRRGTGRAVVAPCWRQKAARAAALTLATLELPDVDVELRLKSNIPTGRGFGSSTADVVAAVRAVMDAAGRAQPESVLARMAVEAETASDPLMIERVVLFGQRSGHILQELGHSLPPIIAVGFATYDRSSRGVDTLSHPPADYSSAEIDQFRRLRADVSRAVPDGDPRLLGRVSTESAWINQRYLPVARLQSIQCVAELTGAVGIQVAHSGDVAALLFSSADATVSDRIAEATSRLSELGVERAWQFRTDYRVPTAQYAAAATAR